MKCLNSGSDTIYIPNNIKYLQSVKCTIYNTQYLIQHTITLHNSNSCFTKRVWCVSYLATWLPAKRSSYWVGFSVIWCSGNVYWMGRVNKRAWAGRLVSLKMFRALFLQQMEWISWSCDSSLTILFPAVCGPEQSGRQTTQWCSLSEYYLWCSNSCSQEPWYSY